DREWLRGLRVGRLDAAGDGPEAALRALVGPGLPPHAKMRAVPAERVMTTPERRAAAKAIMDRLVDLRAQCQRQTGSIVTPMGNEMFYRYQQSLIDEATTTVAAMLEPAPGPPASQAESTRWKPQRQSITS